MKLKPLNKLVCRTPAFSINTSMESVLPALKNKIKESSPAFFDFIEPFNAENLYQLPEKTWFTLWKYFNRAKYRSTPFGSFAAISLLPLGNQKTEKIELSEQMECSHFVDWSLKTYYLKKNGQKINDSTIFLTNSSFYFTGNEIRYLRVKDGQHELATVIAIPELKVLLTTCVQKKKAGLVYKLMETEFSMSHEQTTSLLRQLLALQLIFSSWSPSITGEDYFNRLKVKSPIGPSDYIIAKRILKTGSFNAQYLKTFPSLVNFLMQQFEVYHSTDLNRFKLAFLERFEHQEISLALAMDPEIGLGYGNLAKSYQANPLVEEIKSAQNNQSSATISYGPFQIFLLNKIVAGKDIKLEEFKEITVTKPAKLPNTFSYIFHLFESKPVLAYAGGCTATALIGRFTMDNLEMETYAKEITAIEVNANPDVVFFDIAYQAESRVDNVNRRKILYPYELPILTWSNTESPLDFSDILVTVQGDEVILKSKKLCKRIMPRIPSAYNYTRSDLAVYRFLCDVQSQGLYTQMTFRLQEIFPKLERYPRVSFQEIIVSPAMWLVPKEMYGPLKEGKPKQVDQLKNWLEKMKINFRFKSGYGDATLCFDPKDDNDLVAFLHFCKQQPGDIYIVEALISRKDCISDENKQLYLPQYIVNFSHNQAIYQPVKLQSQVLAPAEQVELPGGDWLYFELYSHVSKGNSLLLNQVRKIIGSHPKFLKKWFFIRYSRPYPHLRIRLHLKHKSDGFQLIQNIKQLIEQEMKLGSITDFQIKTYFREIHRYGAQRMDLIEQFFWVDSKCIFYFLARAKSDDGLLASSLNLILNWLDQWFPVLAKQFDFVQQMANSFASEMQLCPEYFKKINSNFNQLNKNLQQLMVFPLTTHLKAYQQLGTKILSTCNGADEAGKLLADLIHMHVNRTFSVDQRMYETIIYHYLLRMLQIKKAISKI